MIKTRQKNFRAFIFTEGEAEETLEYIEKNLGLLRNLLLVFAYPIGDEKSALHEYLMAKGLNFIESHNMHLGFEQNAQNSESPRGDQAQKQEENSKKDSTNAQKTLVLHRMVRSGEEIVAMGDLTIFGRINSGAVIQCAGNVQIFGAVNGNIFCDGDYMILGSVKEGNILFQGEIVERELFKYPYQKIYRTQNSIVVEELK